MMPADQRPTEDAFDEYLTVLDVREADQDVPLDTSLFYWLFVTDEHGKRHQQHLATFDDDGLVRTVFDERLFPDHWNIVSMEVA